MAVLLNDWIISISGVHWKGSAPELFGPYCNKKWSLAKKEYNLVTGQQLIIACFCYSIFLPFCDLKWAIEIIEKEMEIFKELALIYRVKCSVYIGLVSISE